MCSGGISKNTSHVGPTRGSERATGEEVTVPKLDRQTAVGGGKAGWGANTLWKAIN